MGLLYQLVHADLEIVRSGGHHVVVLASATVVADEDVVCHVLSESEFATLSASAPAIAIKLLAGLGRELSTRLRRANKTIHQLES